MHTSQHVPRVAVLRRLAHRCGRCPGGCVLSSQLDRQPHFHTERPSAAPRAELSPPTPRQRREAAHRGTSAARALLRHPLGRGRCFSQQCVYLLEDEPPGLEARAPLAPPAAASCSPSPGWALERGSPPVCGPCGGGQCERGGLRWGGPARLLKIFKF